VNLLKRLAIKHFNKWDGILAFYIVYNPKNVGKNVFTHMLHPDLKTDEKLDGLLKEVADRVRLFYEDHPELLDEVDCGK